VSEFQLIEWIRQQFGSADKNLILGIGDDAAILEIPTGRQLVVTTDTLNLGVHFSNDIKPADLGHKSLAVNLSDLAAMGASPRWVLLSISLPAEDRPWVEKFIGGFQDLAVKSAVSLVGGDTSAGSLSVTVTAMGLIDKGHALTRAGARPGDLIVVSGCLGDAAYALSRLQKGLPLEPDCLDSFYRPIPRIALGTSLVGKATSCIDISDGLLADLGHLAIESGCGAVIEITRLPQNTRLGACDKRSQWKFQLAGGEDYELCFTIPYGMEENIESLGQELGLQLTVVGHMDEGAGVRCLEPDGTLFEPEHSGYEHF